MALKKDAMNENASVGKNLIEGLRKVIVENLLQCNYCSQNSFNCYSSTSLIPYGGINYGGITYNSFDYIKQLDYELEISIA